MLQRLHIQNYALIATLEMELSNGFIAITGETGAGKSIILGALGLLLGERANLSAIQDTSKKCIIEGEFDIENYDLATFFTENEIDYEPATIIRREITPAGKSRAFINDTPVNLTVLRSLTSKLVDIHSQHQNLEIESEDFQFQLVDSLAQNSAEKNVYSSAFQELGKLEREREKLLAAQQQQNTDIDYWKFQLEELEAVQLQENELEELEQENALFSQMEAIQQMLLQADTFFNSEQSPVDTLKVLATGFGKLKDTHKPSEEFEERLQSSYIELKDLAREIAVVAEDLQNDPEHSAYVSERLDTIYRLLQKHNKQTVTELLDLQEDLSEKVNAIANFDERLEQLEQEIAKQIQLTDKKAEELSVTRLAVIPKIEQQIMEQLQDLGMPHAKIQLHLATAKQFRKQGKEHLSILFSANKNSALANISEVASGGELSRLMLTIKQLMAKSAILPTLIFDEIDTGVSGDIADKMGKMMQTMAEQMQVIVITHLPQIAAKAQQHWEVYKKDTAERTLTEIHALDDAERVEAIAKMLSGSQLTDEALANAKVFLQNN